MYHFDIFVHKMKRIKLIALVAAAAMMVACDPDDDETSAYNDTVPGVKSICEQAIYDSVVTDEYVYTTVWDNSTGLIKSYKTEVYAVVTDSAGVTGKIMDYWSIENYKWNTSRQTAQIAFQSHWYDRPANEWQDGVSFTDALVFDNDWKLIQETHDGVTSTYTYTGKYISSSTGNLPTQYKWKNGDLTQTTERGKSTTIQYTDQVNTLADGFDPTMWNCIGLYHCLGLMGAHTMHLPAKITEEFEVDGQPYSQTLCFEYETGSDGKIAQIKTYYLDDYGQPDASCAIRIYTLNY